MLSDGVIVLRPMTLGDAEAHHAGEDDLTVRFLSGGRSTVAGARAWIAGTIAAWESGAPDRATFGVYLEATGSLIGMAETNVALPGVRKGVANISYGIAPDERGKGYASRAVNLALAYLEELGGVDTALIQVDPENLRSIAVARRCGFVPVGQRAAMPGELFETFLRPVRGGGEPAARG